MGGTADELWSPQGLEIQVMGPGFGSESRTFEIEKPFALVGRADNCDLLLDHADISRWHLYLHRFEDGILFIDLGSRTGTRIDGKRQPRGWAINGHTLSIGPYQLFVPGFDRRPKYDPCRPNLELQEQNQFALRLVGKPEVSERPLDRAITIIGRDAPSTLLLHDETIAKTHLLFYQAPGAIWAINLSGLPVSRNKHRFEAVALDAGDHLQIGKFPFEVVRQVEKQRDAPTPQQTRQGTDDAPSLTAAELQAKAAAIAAAEAQNRQLQATVENLTRELQSARSYADQRKDLADTLNEHVQSLQQELEKAKEELAKSQHASAEMTSKNEELREALQSLEKEMQDLRSEQQRSKDEALELRSQIENLVRERDELAKQQGEHDAHERLQEQLQSLQSENQALKQAAEQFQQQQQDWESRVQDLESSKQDLEGQLTELRQSLDASQQEQAQAAQSMQTASKERDAALEELASLRAQLQEQQQLAQERAADVQRLTAQMQTLQAEQNEAHNSAAALLQEQLDRILNEKLDLQGQVQELLRARQEDSVQLEQLREQLATVEETEFATIQLPDGHASRLAETDRELAEARQQLHEYEQIQQETGKRIAHLSAENQQLQARLAGLETELNSVKEQIKRKDDEAEQLRLQLREQAPEDWTQQKAQLSAELEQAKQNLDAVQQQLDERLAQLEQAQQQAKHSQTLRQSYSTIATQIEQINESIRSDVRAAQDATQFLTDELQNLNQQHDALRQQSEGYQQQIENADGKLDEFLDNLTADFLPRPVLSLAPTKENADVTMPPDSRERTKQLELEKSTLLRELKQLRELLNGKQSECAQLKAEVDRLKGQFVADDYFSYLSRRRETR